MVKSIPVNADGSLADQLAVYENAARSVQRFWRSRGSSLIQRRNRRRAAITTGAHNSTHGYPNAPNRLVRDNLRGASLPYLSHRLRSGDYRMYGPYTQFAMDQNRRDIRDDWIRGGYSFAQRRASRRQYNLFRRLGLAQTRGNEPSNIVADAVADENPFADDALWDYDLMFRNIRPNRPLPSAYDSGRRYGSRRYPTYTMPSGRHYRTITNERMFDAMELEPKNPPRNTQGQAVPLPGDVQRLINDFAFGVPGAPGMHNDMGNAGAGSQHPGISRRNRLYPTRSGLGPMANRFTRFRGSWGPRLVELDYPLNGRSGPVRRALRFGRTDPPPAAAGAGLPLPDELMPMVDSFLRDPSNPNDYDDSSEYEDD